MTLSTPTTSANGATVYVSAYYNNPDGAASVYDDDAVAINWATGAVKWTTPLGVSDGIVDDVPPPVVSPANGSVIASVITDGPPESLLLSAIDPASGKINWKTSVADQPNFTYQFILTLTGDIYVRTNSELVALNASGGSLWTYPVTFGAFNAICVTPDGSSFFPDADDVLYGLSPTGGPLWSKSPKTSGVYTGALTIGPDGVLYAQGSGQSYTKSIYAIDPTTGNYTWQYQTDQPFQYGFAFAHDGTIYYATNQGKLVAVKWTPPPVSP